MTGFMSNTAVEMINGRYRCLDRLLASLGSPQNDQNLAGVIPGRLQSGQRVHYHVLTLLVDV